MAEQTATGTSTVIAEGFIAYGESNPSDGFGSRYEIGRYTTVKEAVSAALGKGVQGDDGSVDSYQVLLYEGGLVSTETQRLRGRRQTPEGSFTVGYFDFREYEYGLRAAADGEIRRAPTSIFAPSKFAVVGEEAEQIIPVDPDIVRHRLSESPEEFVGIWRKVGDEDWRGEFPGGTDKQLDRWLPVR